MSWPWIALVLLGLWHGLNPAMGWLFAVSRGLQERRGAAVAQALPPIALGHALAIGAVLAVMAVARAAFPFAALRWATAAILVAFGVAKLVRHRHPRWVGMRVGFADLTAWSFLMATAHGAGLMLAPIFVVAAPMPSCHDGLDLASPADVVGATLLHTGAMLAMATLLALVVYHKLGLAILRHAWFNVDRLWALALIVSGAAAVLV